MTTKAMFATIVAAAVLSLPGVASAHVPLSGNVPNSGAYVYYSTTRCTEVTSPQIRIDDLPGRPMNIFLRRSANGDQLGTNQRFTGTGYFLTMATNVQLGTCFNITARKDQDFFYGQTAWNGTLHY